MASGDQVKAILRAYKDADENQVITLALQIAAHEAKAGHERLASEIRGIAEQLREKGSLVPRRHPIPIAQPKGELADLIHVTYPETRLDELVLLPETRTRLDRVLSEQRQANRIREHGLHPRSRLLLVGKPGTGKTMSAKALAARVVPASI